MKVTDVFNKNCTCGKTGNVKLIGEKVVFSSSSNSCHPIEINIKELEILIEKHRNGLELHKYISSIKKYSKDGEV